MTINLQKKPNWFEDDKNKLTTVFFVPPTPESKLLKMLKQTERKNMIDEESRVKFLETGGRKGA